MILYPAIDILGGNTVRLTQGDFGAQTTYDEDPVLAARRWAGDGARALHVVDLDGARSGRPTNVEHLERIAAEVALPIQFGGGLRTMDAVNLAVEAGATRVVLGTAALRDVDLLDEALARHGDRIVVSIDARDGRVATEGWTEQTDIPVGPVLDRLGQRGVRRFVFSSINHDGTLSGPDLERARAVAGAVRGSFVYSGGISSLEDLRALAGLRQVNLAGVIVGTALYESRFTVAEGQAALGR
jgi:phosphoribosylformimino-5-aminoimidazole carboxamide ribotide isomerase